MISRDEIRDTYDAIRPYIRRTPVVQVDLTYFDPASSSLLADQGTRRDRSGE